MYQSDRSSALLIMLQPLTPKFNVYILLILIHEKRIVRILDDVCLKFIVLTNIP